jgi:hypothetical protein
MRQLIRVVRRRRLRSIVAVLALTGLASVLAAQQQPARSRPVDAAPYAYLFGETGEFLKLDLRTRTTAARWMLSRLEGLSALLPPFVPAGTPSGPGYWLPAAALSDAAGQRFYLVLPKKSSTAADVGSEGYVVAALDPPALDVRGTISVRNRPVVAVGESRLFISYVTDTTGSRVSARLEVYDSSTMKRVADYVDAIDKSQYDLGQSPTTRLSEGAMITAGDRVIVDRFRRETIGGTTLDARPINPIALLNDSQRQLLRPYERQDAATKRMVLPYSFAASAAGRLVFQVARDDAPQMAVIVVDGDNLRVLSVFVTRLGQIHVTRDGKVALIDEGESRTEDPASGSKARFLFKTGRITRFDLETGRQLDQVGNASLSGRGEFHASVCVGSVDDPTVFAAGDALFVIDWRPVPQIQRADSSLPDGALSKCVLASR